MGCIARCARAVHNVCVGTTQARKHCLVPLTMTLMLHLYELHVCLEGASHAVCTVRACGAI